MESFSSNKDILNQEDLDFHPKHVMVQTRETYGPRWLRFQRFCKGKNVVPQMALLPFIVKFICQKFESGVSHAVMASAITTVSKYHIPDKDSGVNVGRHPLVSTAKKAFWQLRLPLPKYHGTYHMKIVLRFIENLVRMK